MRPFRFTHSNVTANVAVTLGMTDVGTQLDFAQFAQDVGENRPYILLQLVGKAHEEVEAIFDDIESSLQLSDTVVRRWPHKMSERANSTFRLLDQAIPELHHYGVENTKLLEDMRDEVEAWLREHGRGLTPGGPVSPPL